MGSKLRKKIKKVAKKVGRLHAKVAAKSVKVVTPVLAAAATVFVGPAGGAAITAAGGGIARWAGATNARAQGKHGRHARKEGRKLAARTMKYGALATGAGMIGGAIAGGSFLTGLAGAGKLAASGAGKIMPSSGGVTEAPVKDGMEFGWDSLGPPASVPGSGGGQDLDGVKSGWDSLYTPSPGASAPSSPAAANGGNFWEQAALSGIGVLAGGLNRDPGAPGSGKPGEDGSETSTYDNVGMDLFGGGGGGKLLENPLVLAGVAVAAVLLLK